MSTLYSPESERSLLGSFLLFNSLINEAEVSVEDFSASADRAIYRTMLQSWSEGEPFDPTTITSKLDGQLDAVGGMAYLGALTDGAVPDVGIVRVHAKRIRELSHRRRLASLAEQLGHQSKAPNANLDEIIRSAQERLRALKTEGGLSSSQIRKMADIPDIITMKVPPIEYIVPALGIARNTVSLWTGADGDGKTYLAQTMAVAVARGDAFLGMHCLECPVLYLDLENPAYVVQDRLQSMTGGQSIPNLRVWGIWNEQQPPMSGNELLLTIAKETKPLIVIDPFRFFHNGKENVSDEMAPVLQFCRACARYGGAVVILHHPSKMEGSTGRGSGAIRGACDLAFLHSLDKESGLITIKVDKNRNGESRTITLRADFEEGEFEVTDAPYITTRNAEFEKLKGIINGDAGLSQNAICKKSGMRKARCGRLLQEGKGKYWRTEKHGQAVTYWPTGSGSGNHTEPLEPSW